MNRIHDVRKAFTGEGPVSSQADDSMSSLTGSLVVSIGGLTTFIEELAEDAARTGSPQLRSLISRLDGEIRQALATSSILFAEAEQMRNRS